jgi:hypothetical protein
MVIINNVRLIVLCFIVVFAQTLINNLTIFYVDIVGLVLISLLILGNYTWLQLIILSMIADLFGHWLLGTHLLTVVILSNFSIKFSRFYRMCNWLSRTIIANGFFIFFNLIIYMIDFTVGRILISWYSLIVELLILMPLVQLLLQKIIISNASSIVMLYE